MIYVVAGVGPNNLTIPLVLFPTEQEAKDFITYFPHNSDHPKLLDDDFSEKEGIYYDEDDDECMSAIGKELYPKLFKNGNYYSGCGGCHSLTIIPTEFGQPMVGWDLD